MIIVKLNNDLFLKVFKGECISCGKTKIVLFATSIPGTRVTGWCLSCREERGKSLHNLEEILEVLKGIDPLKLLELENDLA